MYKITTIAIKSKLNSMVSGKWHKTQVFQANRPVIYHVCVLKQILDNSMEQNILLSPVI